MVALSALIWWPICAAILVWFCGKTAPKLSRYLTLVSIAICLALLWLLPQQSLAVPWFSRFNIQFALHLDGLAQLLILLTLLLTALATFVSWQEIQHRVGFFHFNLLIALAGINGVFLAADLFMFFFFWEAMLLPITALIAIWGHENRRYAAIKFFIFTQASSLLMLLGIIALAFLHNTQFGVISFNFGDMAQVSLTAGQEMWLMLGFFIAFAVKLPMVPFHTWLPDAHTQAPTAGSVLLAGVLLKTGAYGLIRLVLPLFPNASLEFAAVAATLGVISILYGALMAYSQSDFKRLVAYSSISHMGFILLAVFSWNSLALNGAIVIMIAHGLSSAALFSMAGAIQFRLHSREFADMGGLWQSAPRLGVMMLIFMAAAVGLPGLANFVGEFMALMGSIAVFPIQTILATLGVIGSAIYGLHLFQSAFQGPSKTPIDDLSNKELGYAAVLVVGLLAIGLFPRPLLQITQTSIDEVVEARPVSLSVSGKMDEVRRDP